MNKQKKFVWDENAPEFDEQIEVINEEIEPEPSDYIAPRKKGITIRRVLIVLLVLMISMFFMPLFPVDEVSINETSFITKKELLTKINIKEGERYSLFTMSKLRHELASDTVSAKSSSYSFKRKTLSVKLNEIKPLCVNEDGLMYYSYKDEIDSAKDLDYDVPKVSGFNDKQEDRLVRQLSKLNYNIIKEISVIEYAEDKTRSDLVYMQMKDGNYVDININQIGEKMQYYLQMQKIIDEKKKGQDGVIHLSIGDYYEPLQS